MPPNPLFGMKRGFWHQNNDFFENAVLGKKPINLNILSKFNFKNRTWQCSNSKNQTCSWSGAQEVTSAVPQNYHGDTLRVPWGPQAEARGAFPWEPIHSKHGD